MSDIEKLVLPIRNEDDHLQCRMAAGDLAITLGFGHIDEIRIAVAVSEIVRNVLDYAKHGEMCLAWDGQALVVTISDHGPGIADIGAAMRDGYSTKGSLGLGLADAKRLMGEMEISTSIGMGTTVIMRKVLDHGRAVDRTPAARFIRA